MSPTLLEDLTHSAEALFKGAKIKRLREAMDILREAEPDDIKSLPAVEVGVFTMCAALGIAYLIDQRQRAGRP